MKTVQKKWYMDKIVWPLIGLVAAMIISSLIEYWVWSHYYQ